MILLSAVLQQFMPIIGGVYDARILLLPLCFLCISVTLNPAGMLFIAYICGFIWDAQHVLLPEPENAAYTQPVESLPFGYSIILYAMMGMLMLSIQPLFRQGKWHYSALVTGLAIFLYLTIEYLLIFFVRGRWSFTEPTLLKIIFTSLFTMAASPLVYWFLFKLADSCHYIISYEGLKRKRRYSID